MERYNEFAVRRGDIVICNLGEGIGSEQSGKRPCVVVQNNLGNKYAPTIIVAALTSSNGKSKLPTHIPVSVLDGVTKPSTILCEQLRTIDKRRICGLVGSISDEVMEKVDQAINISLETITPAKLEIIKLAEKLKGRDESICELYGEIPHHLLSQMIIKFKVYLDEFERLCIENRVYGEDFYEMSKELSEIIEKQGEYEERRSRFMVV